MERDKALELIMMELEQDLRHECDMLSAHEGCSRIRERFDVLWDTIKHGRYPGSETHLRERAVRLGAVVVRLLTDLA